jgi:hypothetical protein
MGPLLQVVDDQSIVKPEDVVRVIREAGGRVDGRKPIEDALMEMTGAGRDTCKQAIHRAETSEHIFSATRQGAGRGKTYMAADTGSEE